MSRIGKLPIQLPAKVEITAEGRSVTVKGPNGTLTETLPDYVAVAIAGGQVQVSRVDDSREARAAHGLARTLVNNMVTGVTKGFERKLLITGVGYKAEPRGKGWILFSLGYSHPILFELPPGVTAEIDVKAKEPSVLLKGYNRQVLGAAAAAVRGLRPPEPYKGKGIRYADETILRKEGKAAGKGKGKK